MLVDYIEDNGFKNYIIRNTIPCIKLHDVLGKTGYMELMTYDHLPSIGNVFSGIDRHNRYFIAIKTLMDNKKRIVVIFQRYKHSNVIVNNGLEEPSVMDDISYNEVERLLRTGSCHNGRMVLYSLSLYKDKPKHYTDILINL